MKLVGVLLILAVGSVTAQYTCLSPGCCAWMNQTYETDMASLGSGTPRGFTRLTLPNPELMRTDPCITVSAASTTQHIEVAVEVTGITTGSRLCITVNDSPEPSCASGQVVYCEPVPTVDMTVKIFCDDSCDNSDVEFYYRVNMSSAADPFDEYWCDNRPRDFPSGLLTVVPPDMVTPPTTVTEAGYSLHASLLLILVLVSLLYIIF